MYKLLPQTQTPAGLVDVTIVQRLSDNAFIPMDEQNSDYAEYLKWVAEGNQPEPADELVSSTP
jgi:hypothetical protein